MCVVAKFEIGQNCFPQLAVGRISMGQEQRDYASYLLRLWRSGEDDGALWHASLQNVCESQRMNFPNLDALVEFLKMRYDSSEVAKPLDAVEARADTGESWPQ